MTDTTKRGPNLDIPEGYPVEGFGPGHPPQGSDDFIGLVEHGRHVPELISPPDWGVITSAVWGNVTVPINTKHGELATWDPCYTGEQPWCCPCCWYEYAASVCLTGCVHPGMDIGVAKHTALYAAEGGAAVRVEWDTSYRPYHVRIRTASGETHIYGHMWSVDGAILQGASVHAGQYLGTSGEQTHPGTMIPDESGPHLHFERRLSNNCAVDPTIVLEQATVFQPCLPVAPPPFDGTEKVINGVVFHPAKQTVTAAVDGLNVRRFASVQACKTREPLMAGETIKVLYWIQVADTGERWWVTEDGSRVWTGGTVERP